MNLKHTGKTAMSNAIAILRLKNEGKFSLY